MRRCTTPLVSRPVIEETTKAGSNVVGPLLGLEEIPICDIEVIDLAIKCELLIGTTFEAR